MKHNIRRNMAESYASRGTKPNEYSAAHSSIAIYDLLADIHTLLSERLPEKPMEVLVPAPKAAEDHPSGHPAHVGGIKLNCVSNPDDYLRVSEIGGNRYEFFSEMSGEETLIHLSAEDAKSLARAVLGSD